MSLWHDATNKHDSKWVNTGEKHLCSLHFFDTHAHTNDDDDDDDDDDGDGERTIQISPHTQAGS